MVSDIQKSISSIMYERLSNPFWGTLITSWLVWNWKIVYLTVFISESTIKINKIDYITTNFSNFNVLVTCPLISAFVILLIVPFFSNGAFWVHLKFSKWKLDKKHVIDKSTLLTLEQSIQIREEILKNEKKIENLLEQKNQEIKDLNNKTSHLEALLKNSNDIKPPSVSSSSVSKIAHEIDFDRTLKNSFMATVKHIQGGYGDIVGSSEIDSSAFAYFEAHYLIESGEKGMYLLTDLGRDVLKEVLDF